LARFLGRFVATFECSQHVDASAAAMFITGLASVRFYLLYSQIGIKVSFFLNDLGWMLGYIS